MAIKLAIGDRVRVGKGRETWHVEGLTETPEGKVVAATLRSANRDTQRTFFVYKLSHCPINDAERERQAPRMVAGV